MKRRGLIAAIAALWIAIPGTFIFILIAIALMPAIGTKVYNWIPSRRRVRERLRKEASDNGLNPDWIDAIAYVESRWNQNAINEKGTDALRGGSYGSTQMSWKTLEGIGYTGTREQFLSSLDEQAIWSIRYMTRGNPQSFADAVSWWNAGRSRFVNLPIEHSTRTKYWPKAESALAYVSRNPPESEIVV